MNNLGDFRALPLIDLWGTSVRGRRVEGRADHDGLRRARPGTEVPGHRHEAERLGFVIEGRVRFTVGDEVRDLGPGGTWRIPSGVYHQATARPEGARVIDVFSPPRADWDGLPTSPAEEPRHWPTRR